MALFDNDQHESVFSNLGVDETAKGYLMQTATWCKFLAVVGFVMLGLLVLAGIFMSTMIGSLASGTPGLAGAGGIMTAVYVLIAVLYFFPTYYLFKFSVMIKPALQSGNQQEFNEALAYLRNAFRFIGILMLIVLCLYALVILFGIIAAAVS